MLRGARALRPAPVHARGLLATGTLAAVMVCAAILAAACGGTAPGVVSADSSPQAAPGAAPTAASSSAPEGSSPAPGSRSAPAAGAPAAPAGGSPAADSPSAPAAPGGAGGSDYPCRNWLALDEPTRRAVIEKAIELAKAQGVIVRLPASDYVASLDRLIGGYQAQKNEKALDSSLGLAFHVLAAMEGDWDDGESKVAHAKKWLGPKLFEAFREKYPAKYQHLVELDREAESALR